MRYFFLLFVILAIIIILNQNHVGVFAVFTVNQNGNEDSDTPANIILTKIKYRSDKFSDDIVGQVKNVGNGTADSVQIIITYYDKNGEVIGSDTSNADQDTLKQGQKSPFSQYIDEETGDDIEAYEISLSWENSDGSEEYFENVQVEDETKYTVNLGEMPKPLSDEEIENLGLFER